MKMSLGEICDRYSIVKLKSERTELDCSEEFRALEAEVRKYEDLEVFIDQLYDVNGLIWDLESDIRRGKEKELGMLEVGRRAIAIRNLNGQRVSTKNQINKKYKSGFQETKVDHASSN